MLGVVDILFTAGKLKFEDLKIKLVLSGELAELCVLCFHNRNFVNLRQGPMEE
jgi:hypothetical protein